MVRSRDTQADWIGSRSCWRWSGRCLRLRDRPRSGLIEMAQADIARLLALAIIWSLSFVFIRVLVPALGPVWVPMLRALIAGVALTAWFAFIRLDADVKRHWRSYLFVGVLNSALPFLLFALAAVRLPASYLEILNALLPL